MTDVFVKQRNRDTDTLGEVMGGWGGGGEFIMSFAGKWMELGINEISQTQKEKKCHLLPFRCGILICTHDVTAMGTVWD